MNILCSDRPVQFIFAGKAHPHDNEGKEFIRQIIHFVYGSDCRSRIVFLEDYDMVVARYLVQGIDVWLNRFAAKSNIPIVIQGSTPLEGFSYKRRLFFKDPHSKKKTASFVQGYLSEVIENHLRELILSGEVRPGDKLPSEKELSNLLILNVSPSMRTNPSTSI